MRPFKRRCTLADSGLSGWQEVFFSHGVGLLPQAELVALLAASKAWAEELGVYLRPQYWLHLALDNSTTSAEYLTGELLAAAESARCYPQLNTSLTLIYKPGQLPAINPIPASKWRLLQLALPWFHYVADLTVECDSGAAAEVLRAWVAHGPAIRRRLRAVSLQLSYDGDADERTENGAQTEAVLRELLSGVQELSLGYLCFGPQGVGSLWPQPGPVPPLRRLALVQCSNPRLFGEAFKLLAPTLEELEVWAEDDVTAPENAVALFWGSQQVCWPRLRRVSARPPVPPEELIEFLKVLDEDVFAGLDARGVIPCVPALQSYTLNVANCTGDGGVHQVPGAESWGQWRSGLLERLHQALCPRGGPVPNFLKLRLHNVDLQTPPSEGDLAALRLLAPAQLTLVDRGPAMCGAHPTGALLEQLLQHRHDGAAGGPRRLGLTLALWASPLAQQRARFVLPFGSAELSERARLGAWAHSYQRLFARRGLRVADVKEFSFYSFWLDGYLPREDWRDLAGLIELQRLVWRGLCSLGAPLYCGRFWLPERAPEEAPAPLPQWALPAHGTVLPRGGMRGKFSLLRRFLSPLGEVAYAVKEFSFALSRSSARLSWLQLNGECRAAPGWASAELWTFLVCSGLLGDAARSDQPLAILAQAPPWGHTSCSWPYARPWFDRAGARCLLGNYASILFERVEAAAYKGGSAHPSLDTLVSELKGCLASLRDEDSGGSLWFQKAQNRSLSGYVLEDTCAYHNVALLSQSLAFHVETALSQPYSHASWKEMRLSLLLPLSEQLRAKAPHCTPKFG